MAMNVFVEIPLHGLEVVVNQRLTVNARLPALLVLVHVGETAGWKSTLLLRTRRLVRGN